MTDKVLQIRVNIDPIMHEAFQSMKLEAQKDYIGRHKPTVQKLIEGKLIKLHREKGFNSVIHSNPSFPNIYAPPNKSDTNSFPFALRVNDPNVRAALIEISTKTTRPPSHIIYSLLRYIVESSYSLSTKTRISA